jgi:hypothetical protein
MQRPYIMGHERVCQRQLVAGIQFSEAFHQIVNGFHLHQERFQLIQRQRRRTITFGITWIWVCLDKQASQTYRHTGTSQFGNLRAAAT